MKILFTRFPLESAHGGAESQTISLMKGLKQRGHAVAFLGSCPTLLVLCQQHQIPCASLDIGPPPVSKEAVFNFFWKKKKMKNRLEKSFEEFRQHGLDAIFMLSLSEKLLLTHTAVEANVKTFWVEHDTIGSWIRKNPYRRKLRKISKFATTIGVSQLSRKLYIELGWDPKTVVNIPNGIDPERFSIEPSEKRIPSERPHIGCVARLSEEKGLDLLIKAVRDVPSSTLSIIGVGKERDHLERLISKHDLKDRVTIESRKGNLGAFYNSLDMFVLPSRHHDPFGLVAAEAMMLGIPVVVTDACGIAGQLTHGKDAIIVEANSLEALKEGISELLIDDKLAKSIAHSGQHKALSDFTVTSMIDRYEELLLRKK